MSKKKYVPLEVESYIFFTETGETVKFNDLSEERRKEVSETLLCRFMTVAGYKPVRIQDNQ